MTTALPLFPLGTVLFPGLVMPLHVFEQRYRTLVRDLLDRPDETTREFGVVAIRRGWEVAESAMSSSDVALYDVGCTAQVRRITEREDGTYDIVTVGRRRFEIERVLSAETPYLQAEIRYLPEQAGPEGEAERLVPRVLAAFRAYLSGLSSNTGGAGDQLPEDPLVLSHLVAATAMLNLDDRQRLLATPDTAGRLRAELRLLNRELALLRQVRAVPVAPSELPVQPGPN